MIISQYGDAEGYGILIMSQLQLISVLQRPYAALRNILGIQKRSVSGIVIMYVPTPFLVQDIAMLISDPAVLRQKIALVR